MLGHADVQVVCTVVENILQHEIALLLQLDARRHGLGHLELLL